MSGKDSEQSSSPPAPQSTRRDFLRRVGGGAFAAGLARGIRPSQAEASTASQETTPNTAHIRQRIVEYEQAHKDEVTPETITHLHGIVKELYEETFKTPSLNAPLRIMNEDDFQRVFRLQRNQLPLVPSGATSRVVDSPRGTTPENVPLLFYLGNSGTLHPDLNKLSVARAALMYHFIASETRPAQESGVVKVGGVSFQPEYRTGLKWITGPELDWGNHKGVVFDTFSNFVLAEYMNNPTGNDTLFRRISENPTFQETITPAFFEGMNLMKSIFAKSGVSLQAVEAHHKKSQPRELLETLDRNTGTSIAEPMLRMDYRSLINVQPLRDIEMAMR